MTEKLKPCPFCGSTKLKIDSKRTFNYSKRHCSVTVRCMKCHARSPVVGISMDKNQYNERELCESQAIEAWNRRVSEDKFDKDTLAELCEAKRLLKVAVEDIHELLCDRENLGGIGQSCNICSYIDNCPCCNRCDIIPELRTWRYADEALALIGEDGDTNG